ncbi:MAG: hypothetical protein WCY06_04790 [Flavobacteriaceae bacterium]
MINKILILLLFPGFCFSQQIIKGKIITETPEISGILVVNLTTESETKTDGFGRFSIEAKTDDLLVVSAPHIYKKRHLVEANDFKRELQIEVEVQPIEIEAVEINAYSYINSENLGIVPKGQKRYTKAERKLFTAGQMSIGTSISLDAIINAISGRTKILKKIVEMERENQRIAYLTNSFPEEFYTETLEILPDNVEEFKFFVLYNLEKDLPKKQKETYIRSLKKEELELKIIPLASLYLKLKTRE